MSEFQVVTVVATTIGLVATVLNLVVFLREKERSHIRAGFRTLAVLGLLLLIYLAPRLAPGPVQGLLQRLPARVAEPLRGWAGTTPAPAASPAAVPAGQLQGSFVLELHRNLFGGVDALVARFHFSNLSQSRIRVTAYHLQFIERDGTVAHTYDRVLPESISVAGGCIEQKELELDAEIRDAWLAWQEREASERGRLEVTWEAQSAEAQAFSVRASNG